MTESQYKIAMFNSEPQQEWQSNCYREARQNFLRACEDAGVTVTSYNHPLHGPEGEPLATDAAWFGAENASRLLVMVSGVHGVEGFSGSATQVGWIESGFQSKLAQDTAVLMIHMINPWGAAYLRRFTEDNVDLCRNFLDFSQPLPQNRAYSNVHAELSSPDLLGDNGELAGAYLAKTLDELGIEGLVDLFMQGQYQHPDGFSFGGQQPTWSNRCLREILDSYGQRATQVCVVEFHTGLGPWGYGEIITLQNGPELDRVRDWFGPWVFNPEQDKNPDEPGYRAIKGHSTECYRESFTRAKLSVATLEFGTYPPQQTLALLLREHFLLQQDTPDPQLLAEVKAQLLEFHHPQNWEWRCAFWSRSLQVIRQALRGLNSA